MTQTETLYGLNHTSPWPYLATPPQARNLATNPAAGTFAWCRSATHYSARLGQRPEETDDKAFIGFDTGTRNAGLALILGNRLDAWQITWADFPSYAEGVEYVFNVVKSLADDPNVRLYASPGRAVIEAGAFSRGLSSTTTGLEALRTAALLAFIQLRYQVQMSGPSTITKAVLGSGKLRAKEVWGKALGPDAAAAFGCALYARLVKP